MQGYKHHWILLAVILSILCTSSSQSIYATEEDPFSRAQKKMLVVPFWTRFNERLQKITLYRAESLKIANDEATLLTEPKTWTFNITKDVLVEKEISLRINDKVTPGAIIKLFNNKYWCPTDVLSLQCRWNGNDNPPIEATINYIKNLEKSTKYGFGLIVDSVEKNSIADLYCIKQNAIILLIDGARPGWITRNGAIVDKNRIRMALNGRTEGILTLVTAEKRIDKTYILFYAFPPGKTGLASSKIRGYNLPKDIESIRYGALTPKTIITAIKETMREMKIETSDKKWKRKTLHMCNIWLSHFKTLPYANKVKEIKDGILAEDADADFAKAKKLMERGKLKQALYAMEDILRDYPEYPKIKNVNQQILIINNQIKANKYDIVKTRANNYERKGKFGKAVEEFSLILKVYPKFVPDLNKLKERIKLLRDKEKDRKLEARYLRLIKNAHDYESKKLWTKATRELSLAYRLKPSSELKIRIDKLKRLYTSYLGIFLRAFNTSDVDNLKVGVENAPELANYTFKNGIPIIKAALLKKNSFGMVTLLLRHGVKINAISNGSTLLTSVSNRKPPWLNIFLWSRYFRARLF